MSQIWPAYKKTNSERTLLISVHSGGQTIIQKKEKKIPKKIRKSISQFPLPFPVAYDGSFLFKQRKPCKPVATESCHRT
jgi:hypothetical protein